MRRFLHIGMVLTAAIGLLALVGCGVGEHENPIPPSMAGAEAQDTYTNADFGVHLTYPASWIIQEAADGTSVSFTSADAQPTRVTASFARLDPAPASLVEYLAEQYPTWTFITADTATLTGLFFDDPVAGPNGGDVREYFYLKGAVLVHVHVEFFPERKAAFLTFLDGMTID